MWKVRGREFRVCHNVDIEVNQNACGGRDGCQDFRDGLSSTSMANVRRGYGIEAAL
jgi:hypothetical protein